MKYRLGDICTITKGATGIMKAIPGDFTMVALGEVDRTHNEYQFDAKAAIIPLVSSTGHGHASMKRVKYQEGKFALGNILCAVIPKDEKVVLAKYLHIYLHWNREELLVSQMKGMANVSLSLNKIADVEVIVPSVQKQREIIELEQQLEAKEKEADKLFADQLTQLENLNKAILQEAVQGKLVAQNPTDGNAKDLLKQIKVECINKNGALAHSKKEKPLPSIKSEEIPFEIPESWVWCRFREIANIINGRAYKAHELLQEGTPVLRVGNFFTNNSWYYSNLELDENKYCNYGDLLYAWSASFGPKIWDGKKVIFHYHIWKIDHVKDVYKKFIYYFLAYDTELIKSKSRGVFMLHMTKENMEKRFFPLPPLSEQKRIVAEIERQLEKTKQLKEHIVANQQATEQLLKALLHGAFEVEEKKETKTVSFVCRKSNLNERTVLAAYLIKQFNSEGFGRVMLMKLLFLVEYICKIDFESHYVVNVAGPYDDLIKEIEIKLRTHKIYNCIQNKFDNHVHYQEMTGVDQVDELFESTFAAESILINELVHKFKKSTWDQCEIVATMYAVWNNRIRSEKPINDMALKQDFLNWDPQKRKYKDRLDAALDWMRRKEIVPDGWGQLIEK